MDWLIASVVVLAIVLSFVFKRGIFKRGTSKSISNENWQHLLRICFGNEKQAQRLLEHEKRINLQLTDDEACRMAILSYKRDNR
jgi:hypothetical protein